MLKTFSFSAKKCKNAKKDYLYCKTNPTFHCLPFHDVKFKLSSVKTFLQFKEISMRSQFFIPKGLKNTHRQKLAPSNIGCREAVEKLSIQPVSF